jgi:hypothetical protein
MTSPAFDILGASSRNVRYLLRHAVLNVLRLGTSERATEPRDHSRAIGPALSCGEQRQTGSVPELLSHPQVDAASR